ncbi:unnamed protein product, partial [Scytosiphon promiscuus]
VWCDLFWEHLKSVLRALQIFLRGVKIGLISSPLILSGSVLGVLHRMPFIPEEISVRLNDWWWTFLLKAISQCGPTFIKAAQWISTRQDMFPEVVCSKLSAMHTSTRKMPMCYGEEALEQAFGPSWREFMKLEEEALGSGCVASVYKGHMSTGESAGQEIAVKVLHPDIRKTVQLDLALLRKVAEVAEKLPFLQLHWLSLSEFVGEFSSLMEMQMDLRLEAINLERFISDFKDDPKLSFPRPIRPWVSEGVLVEEFLRGSPISNFFPSAKLARMGLQAFLNMVFLKNFVHGDLHPGNLMVGKGADGEGDCLIFLDAGIVCELDQHDRENFLDLFHAVVVGNGTLAGSLMIERARDGRCTDPEGFCEGVNELVQNARSSGLRLREIQAGELLERMFRLCMKHEVKLESKFARLLIAITILEGVGRSLDPNCNILNAALPVVLKAAQRKTERVI